MAKFKNIDFCRSVPVIPTVYSEELSYGEQVGKLQYTVNEVIRDFNELSGDVDAYSSKITNFEIDLENMKKVTADANTASAQAARVSTDAFAKATNASQTANAAVTTAEAAKTTAEAANNGAAAAGAAANNANQAAALAISSAQTAQSIADSAKDIADTAKERADGAFAKATNASQTANAAVTTAEAAKTTAEAAKTTAEAANNGAAAAGAAANNANQAAALAISSAQTAQTTADTAISDAFAAQKSADESRSICTVIPFDSDNSLIPTKFIYKGTIELPQTLDNPFKVEVTCFNYPVDPSPDKWLTSPLPPCFSATLLKLIIDAADPTASNTQSWSSTASKGASPINLDFLPAIASLSESSYSPSSATIRLYGIPVMEGYSNKLSIEVEFGYSQNPDELLIPNNTGAIMVTVTPFKLVSLST